MADPEDDEAWVLQRQSPHQSDQTQYWCGPGYDTEYAAWTPILTQAKTFRLYGELHQAWKQQHPGVDIPSVHQLKTARKFAEAKAASATAKDIVSVANVKDAPPLPQTRPRFPAALHAGERHTPRTDPFGVSDYYDEGRRAREKEERLQRQRERRQDWRSDEDKDWEAYVNQRYDGIEAGQHGPGLLSRVGGLVQGWHSFGKPRRSVVEIFDEVFEDYPAQPRDPDAPPLPVTMLEEITPKDTAHE